MDRRLVSLIYRRPRSFTFDPLLLIGMEVFGATKADINVMKIGMPGVEHGPGYTDDGRRMAVELHQQLAPNLEGKIMFGMVSRFTEGLMANLEEEFTANGKFGTSGDWVAMDFCNFAKRHFTIASIPSLFGSHLMKVWPRAYEDFWEFDENLPKLLLNLPRTFIPAAYEARDRALYALRRWQADAEKYRHFKSVEMADPDWDEYWGTRLVRARHGTCLKNGISKRGRPAFELAMLWGYGPPTHCPHEVEANWCATA
jgi:ATP-binding cassette subfamily D (ALD) long-chain fatty acid import protein